MCFRSIGELRGQRCSLVMCERLWLMVKVMVKMMVKVMAMTVGWVVERGRFNVGTYLE